MVLTLLYNIHYFIYSSVGALTYDKSSLTEQWQEISSRENMAPLDDDDYDDYYDEDYDGESTRKRQRDKKKSSDKKSGTSNYCQNLSIIILSLFLSRYLSHCTGFNQ